MSDRLALALEELAAAIRAELPPRSARRTWNGCYHPRGRGGPRHRTDPPVCGARGRATPEHPRRTPAPGAVVGRGRVRGAQDVTAQAIPEEPDHLADLFAEAEAAGATDAYARVAWDRLSDTEKLEAAGRAEAWRRGLLDSVERAGYGSPMAYLEAVTDGDVTSAPGPPGTSATGPRRRNWPASS